MLYLDYAKPLTGGKYILNFFAESIEDLDNISHGQRFITKNGIDYGVPQPSSTVVITMPDKTKKTYVLNEAGEWQEGGVDMDYSKLENAPIILANLADKEFIPEANTYYEHLGETTEDFIKGIIYLYDGKEYKAIDGSGSGAGVQSDYNQNDNAAADYIKNRPFYEETKTALAEVFNETLAFEWDTEVNLKFSVSEFAGAPMKGVAVGESVTVIFNGVEYNLTTQELPDEFKGEVEAVGGAGFLAGAAWPTSESWTPPENLPFSLVCMWASIDGQEAALVYGVTTINQASIPVIIKTNKTTRELHTIDPKFIKDMYYETTNTETLLEQTFTTTTVDNINFWATNTSFINFVKGDTVTINYKGTEYTQKVKELNTVLYVGNLALGGLSPATNEPFLIANIYYPDGLSKLTPGITVATSETQTDANIKVYKSVQNVHTIEPKYIKDMYYEETRDTILQIVSGTYTGTKFGEAYLTMFPVTTPLIADKTATIKTSQGLEDTRVVKNFTSDGTTAPYSGNLGLLGNEYPNTGETYVFYTVEVEGSLLGVFVQTTPFTDMKIEVSQFGIGRTIVKMPLKYLPDEAATKSDVAKAIAEAITTALNTDV